MLERGAIAAALARLAELLSERGAEGEVRLLGGTMVLAFDARASTKDVTPSFDPRSWCASSARAWLRSRPAGRRLTDEAKGLILTNHELAMGELPQSAGLRVLAPTAEYTFEGARA